MLWPDDAISFENQQVMRLKSQSVISNIAVQIMRIKGLQT